MQKSEAVLAGAHISELEQRYV